jgi:hypothetical protein
MALLMVAPYLGMLRPAVWSPTYHRSWSGVKEYGVHLFSLTQFGRLVLSGLGPFTQVIDIMQFLYLIQAEVRSYMYNLSPQGWFAAVEINHALKRTLRAYGQKPISSEISRVWRMKVSQGRGFNQLSP